ncbi:hypothetical protein BLNAU_16590 [Blattamonas nauphoetae]|uniref:Uncharacterized protein n=1 Tax=Blattamonas nauphoetae TaxID=2049346 RepID=A0ABQ9XAR8_9EUKA|nr:hypothetical protein BLNAU_16590 [Blattamonas nauphoetae]
MAKEKAEEEKMIANVKTRHTTLPPCHSHTIIPLIALYIIVPAGIDSSFLNSVKFGKEQLPLSLTTAKHQIQNRSERARKQTHPLSLDHSHACFVGVVETLDRKKTTFNLDVILTDDIIIDSFALNIPDTKHNKFSTYLPPPLALYSSHLDCVDDSLTLMILLCLDRHHDTNNDSLRRTIIPKTLRLSAAHRKKMVRDRKCVSGKGLHTDSFRTQVERSHPGSNHQSGLDVIIYSSIQSIGGTGE